MVLFYADLFEGTEIYQRCFKFVFSCLSQKEVLVVEHGDDSILVEHADSDEELNELDEEPLLLRAHPEPQALLVFTPR